ncbi:PAS domain-containing protein, partial [bacterium]|nr:PAS domain-containing protein [bacterium]
MADLEPFQAYQPIVEDLPYGVMVWHALSDNSSDLRLVYANREASVGLDRDLAVDIGKTIAEAFPQALRKPETGRRFVDVWLEAALKQEPAVIEEFTFGAHLFPRPRYNAAVVPLGERIVACVFKDITQERLIAATLEQREQLYRRMVETLPHPVWLAEANGEVIFLNEAWRVLTGQAQAESLGAGWLQAIHPEDKERVSELFAGEISTAMVQKGRMRVLGKGAERHLEYIFRPVRDAVGQISHWIGVATDITEIQRSQTALQNTAAFLDSIIENIPDMIFIKEAEELRFVRFNKAGEDLLGIPRTEMIGKNDYDFFPPDQAKAFNEDDWKVLRNRVPVTQPEEPIDTRDKGRRWLLTKKVLILDEDGHPSYLLGISYDVTT